MDWIYVAIMATAVTTGVALYHLTRKPLDLIWWERSFIVLGAFCGGILGAKLPFLLSDWSGFLDGTAWLTGGKTIVSGLIGGYLGVQVAEWTLGKPIEMCDSFAVPVAGAIAVGRLGCFHAGCCHGSMTSLPWGVDFGDGQLRHPTQLYEFFFHACAAVALFQLYRRDLLRGQHIRLYFLAYFIYRFLTEFVRPEARLWIGLTGYQWGAIFLTLVLLVWGLPCCRARWTWRSRRRAIGRPIACSLQPNVLKQTLPLCPTCLQKVPGVVFEQQGRVMLRRECPEHGETVAVINSDRRHYYLRHEVPHPPPAEKADGCDEGCCGALRHKTCVALLELTEACNLQCPVCFASSPSGKHRPYPQLCADLEAFVTARGSLDILQLSGGEPLLHPDLLRIVDHAKTLSIDHIMINTNGLPLVDGGTLATELARRKPHLELSLQYDGVDRNSHLQLRGTDLLARKQEVLQAIREHDLPTTLVCTVAHQANESQLGDLLRLGLGMPQIRGITYQPATWSGRFERPRDPHNRLTAGDVIRLLAMQSGGLLGEEDFKPLPCGDPNCCSFTFVARKAKGEVVPLTRIFSYEDHVDQLADRMNFNLTDAWKCCGVRWRVEDYFRVVVKPFMDAFTYDQTRVDECCIHMIQPGGSAVSFCQFNTLQRGQMLMEDAAASKESELANDAFP